MKKNAYGLLVFFNQIRYMQLSHMIPGVNIISRKVSVASFNGGGGSEGVLRPQGTPKKGSREHLNWLKIDLNEAKIITIQDYKHIQN